MRGASHWDSARIRARFHHRLQPFLVVASGVCSSQHTRLPDLCHRLARSEIRNAGKDCHLHVLGGSRNSQCYAA